MKKIIILSAIMFISAITARAQNQNLEKLNNYKIGFFTKKLNLTSAEAEKFWPVYNEYQNKKNQIQMEKIRLNRNFNQNGDSMSDRDLEEISDKYVNLIVQESDLAVDFHKKLKEVLAPVKVVLYYQAENQFKVQLLNELQSARQQQKIKPLRNY